jgi:hypothetical protein
MNLKRANTWKRVVRLRSQSALTAKITATSKTWLSAISQRTKSQAGSF